MHQAAGAGGGGATRGHFLQQTTADVGWRRGIVDDAREGWALVVRAVAIGDELHDHQPLTQRDLLAAESLANATQHDHLHELFAFVRHRTEAVLQALAIGLQGAVVFDGIEFTIEQHALRRARHVGIGEIHRQVALDGAVGNKNLPRPLRRRGGPAGWKSVNM